VTLAALSEATYQQASTVRVAIPPLTTVLGLVPGLMVTVVVLIGGLIGIGSHERDHCSYTSHCFYFIPRVGKPTN